MLRSGLILSVGGPAALLTMLVLPVVQREADRWSHPVATSQQVPASLTPAIIHSPAQIGGSDIAVLRVTTAVSNERRAPAFSSDQDTVSTEKPVLKPRRTMRDGCEGAISSLAGPEARRMIPGRCIA